MAPVDLDQFHRDWTFSREVAPTIEALAAELRAAREVVKAAQGLLNEVTVDWREPRQLLAALAAYDQATGGERR